MAHPDILGLNKHIQYYGFTSASPNEWNYASLDFPTGSTIMEIQFQCGPIPQNGINGVGIENVLEVCRARLQMFQEGPFKCRENALALTKIEEALLWLGARTALRQEQGVEGTNNPHKS